MKKSKKYIFLLIVFIVSSSVIAQEKEKPLESGPIDSQFEYMINNSNRYMDFKVIRKTWLDKFNSNVADSLEELREEIVEIQKITSDQINDIEVLKNELETTNDQLTSIQVQKDSIELFGIQIQKNIYMNMTWSVTGLLIVLLLIFVYKFKRSNLLTQESKNALSELREEFETHRKKALEKEQVLARELQNELNKTSKFK
ncbi:MAG: tRNA (guanine-N1)-methyltransferase [Bacteroidota bacterium]|nr:tRNA (guanine-N1)-methyltransferase [Bacteroidota bacterium]